MGIFCFSILVVLEQRLSRCCVSAGNASSRWYCRSGIELTLAGKLELALEEEVTSHSNDEKHAELIAALLTNDGVLPPGCFRVKTRSELVHEAQCGLGNLMILTAVTGAIALPLLHIVILARRQAPLDYPVSSKDPDTLSDVLVYMCIASSIIGGLMAVVMYGVFIPRLSRSMREEVSPMIGDVWWRK